MITHEIASFFPTIVHLFDASSVLPAESMLERVDELRSSGTSSQLTESPLEWLSDAVLHLDPAFARLVEVAAEVAEEALRAEHWDVQTVEVSTCWAIVQAPGGIGRAHVHPNALLSGVWFGRVPEGAGRLLFHDPRPGRMIRLPTSGEHPETVDTITLVPREGLLAVFPSWLPHSVGRNLGASDRVSVAFNISAS